METQLAEREEPKPHAEPEPQLEALGSPSDAAADAKSKKKKKKKKKSRRKSLEANELPDNQEEEEASIEADTAVEVAEEVDTTVEITKEEAATVEATKEEAVAVEAIKEEAVAVEAIKEEVVAGEATKEEAFAAEVTKDEKTEPPAETSSGDELGPPELERTTSLDSLKASGTRAVGSLFSRFKVGRAKKPLPSRTESAAKLELVNPSPVKTAVKKLEVPEEKSLEDLPMRTKRDFFGNGEQSVHVSAEKEKFDAMEKQRKEEEEAAAAQKHSPSSSTKSKEEVHAESRSEVPTSSAVVEAETEVVQKSDADGAALEAAKAVAPESIEATVESRVGIDKAELTVPDEEAFLLSNVELNTAPNREDNLKSTIAPDEATNADRGSEKDAPLPSSEVSAASSTTLKTELVSLELDLNLEPDREKEESTLEQAGACLELHVPTPASEVNKTVQSEEAELLPVKITPSSSKLHEGKVMPEKPEKLSPVKSLASRFEGKREQSLDSLKFRTVREFFPEERSIRVGAEKQKYEAQAQQQKLKAKAEEEAKSKYNIGSSFKSPENSVAATAASLVANSSASTDTVVVTAATDIASTPPTSSPVDFSTPETSASKKHFSFHNEHASSDSPAKLNNNSPEALTPVKSIASRFEGKREQSLDSLKFRTVREFFPEERSVRVGSEKQKFEAQAQQDKSLDNLKFRTVREFFPEEGKRSIHVGAEKAKFEALTKQQEEAAKAEEQIKLKHVASASSSPITGKAVNAEGSGTEIVSDANSDATRVDPTVEKLVSAEERTSLDDGATEAATNSADVAAVVEGDLLSIRNDVNEAADKVSADGAEEGITVPMVDADSVEASKESAFSVGEVEPNVVEATTDLELSVPRGNSNAGDEVVEPADESKVSSEKTDFSNVSTDNEIVELAGDNLISDGENVIFEQEVDKSVLSADSGLVQVKLEEAGVNTQTESTVTATSKNGVNVDQINATVEQAGESQNSAQEVVTNLVDAIEQETATPTLNKVGSNDSDQLTTEGAKEQESAETIPHEVDSKEFDELYLGEPVPDAQVKPSVSPAHTGNDLELQPSVKSAKAESPVEQSTSGTGNGVVEVDLKEEAPTFQPNQKPRPMLTTERSFVMEKDHTIETEDTVVVGERPMTDGEDELEPLSPTKARPAHEEFAGITSPKVKKTSSSSKITTHESKASPKLTRMVSAGSTGSMKSPSASTTVPVSMKRASITAPTASYMAKKTAEANELHKSSPQLKKKLSATKVKGTVSDTGFIKPPPAAPTVPVPIRASITAPTASYMAKKATESEEAHRASPQPKLHHSAKSKGTVGPTGFIKSSSAAPTVPVPLKRASITAPTASWQARNVPNNGNEIENRQSFKNHASKSRSTVGLTGVVKPIPPPPTVPVAPKRASIMAPTASYIAKKAVEHEDVVVAEPSVPSRSKRYSGIKSKVLEGIQSGSTHAVTHKTITKEEFIAAERRKSLGSAGVRSVLNAVDRRASLSARVTIDGPPEPFVRSALSRKKLNSTVPRYMDYENTPGYAERAQKQYERRKRLEEENAAKSEKRQRELRMFFADKQQKALSSSADEVRRGLEAHEFARLAKESEIAAKKALRKEKQRAASTRSHRRASSATSSAGTSSSNGKASRASKKSSVVSEELKTLQTDVAVETHASVEEFVKESDVPVAINEAQLNDEVVTEELEIVVETIQAEEQVSIADEDPALEYVAKKIDFDEASSDSDEKGVSNE
ncbi:unnamed protein product [Phytophthora lilii]|uniref:Unnamed protein product n=1 Tax=Phytophthora lilii TaxID=2077276 RepID=A0A9W6TJZ6_9STRA|nr:unnamed protein product [Phytophthora lilii]